MNVWKRVSNGGRKPLQGGALIALPFVVVVFTAAPEDVRVAALVGLFVITAIAAAVDLLILSRRRAANRN